jgi:hypothetical protein
MSSSIESTELVNDPVGHISISGVHGRRELEDRLAHAPRYHAPRKIEPKSVALGAALGAVIVFLLKR